MSAKSPAPSNEERVRGEAARVGFDAVRITTAEPPAHNDAMTAWLRAGMHGEMGYLARHEALRAAPLGHVNLLDDARSVIVVAQSYHFPVLDDEAAGDSNIDRATFSPRGVVARYARGSHDYHTVVRAKLNTLASFVEREFSGHRARGFCDSGPIRERELARRCGLGWQGKHTGLISLDLGNWFFLGALLTTLPLEPDDALAESHCGTCTRCLAACPTGAIVAPMTLDARRCISYLTIELKGPIPVDLRPLMGNRIFGCDDCLAACPWNDGARAGHELRLAAQDSDAAFPNLLALLDLLGDEGAFRARFSGTPLLRPGRAGLRRNVCVALGNVGDETALPALRGVCETEPSEMVREHARWAMGEIARRREPFCGMTATE